MLTPGDQPTVQTKGDANGAADPWQARLKNGPAWRVAFTVPRLGYVLAWLRHPMPHALTVILAPLLLGAIWLAHIWRPKGENS